VTLDKVLSNAFMDLLQKIFEELAIPVESPNKRHSLFVLCKEIVLWETNNVLEI
jgi:hypothetical protein